MKKLAFIFFISVLIMPCYAKTVERVDADLQVDASGYWNDSDVRIVCEGLIEQALNSGGFSGYKEDLGRRPIVTGGLFRNDSSEYIDTSILTEGITTAILNSGKARFIASKKRIEEIREERFARASWSDPTKQKEAANELIPDLILTGSVKTVVDTDTNITVRTYFVFAEMVDIETGELIWKGENKDIKKVIGSEKKVKKKIKKSKNRGD